MLKQRAAELLKAVKQDLAQQVKLEVMNNPMSWEQLAKSHGYKLTEGDLEQWLDQLPMNDLASIVNPGIGIRHHLIPR